VTSPNPIDEVTGTETTGHEWDGIRELNTPLPRWWLYVMYATIVWSIGYWIVMPSWPLVSSYSKGVIGYSDRVAVAERLAEARAGQSEFLDRISAHSVQEIVGDAALRNFSIAGGASAFAVNCSQCHGRGAAGGPGYPNLNDDDWLWGGTPEAIHQSIQYGIRSGHEETRDSAMPAFLRDQILDRGQVEDVVEYVLSLSGRGEDDERVARGKTVFAEQCTACHGDQGAGNMELGAPNLGNSIWLFGDDRATITSVVSNSRRGVMPAWEGRLDAVVLKQLSVFVHSLGGGQ
jgi:cytochrome c oxidase cbb3-type subunit 3